MPAESWADVSVHGFCKWGTPASFYIQNVKLYAGPVCARHLQKTWQRQRREKDKYLQTCLKRRHTFNTMMYSTDGIPITEAVVAQLHLASLLSNKLKREYLEMCGFVWENMSPAIVRSNTLLL